MDFLLGGRLAGHYVIIFLQKNDRIAAANTCIFNVCHLRMLCGLFCSVCDSHHDCAQFPVKQRKFDPKRNVLATVRRRCYKCGHKAEAASINDRRVRHLYRICYSCCEELRLNPPPYNYLKNQRHKRKRCGRCIQGLAPKWSIQLQSVCRSWWSLAENSTSKSFILFLIIRTLGMSTKYLVPWKDRPNSGLPRIALFLGGTFVQRPPLRRGGPLFTCWHFHNFSLPARQPRWIIDKNNRVIERVCCSAAWFGWYCHVCKQQH